MEISFPVAKESWPVGALRWKATSKRENPHRLSPTRAHVNVLWLARNHENARSGSTCLDQRDSGLKPSATGIRSRNWRFFLREPILGHPAGSDPDENPRYKSGGDAKKKKKKKGKKGKMHALVVWWILIGNARPTLRERNEPQRGSRSPRREFPCAANGNVKEKKLDAACTARHRWNLTFRFVFPLSQVSVLHETFALHKFARLFFRML